MPCSAVRISSPKPSVWPYSSTEGNTANTIGRPFCCARPSFQAVRRSARSQRWVKCANAHSASRLFSPVFFGESFATGVEAGQACSPSIVGTFVSLTIRRASGPA